MSGADGLPLKLLSCTLSSLSMLVDSLVGGAGRRVTIVRKDGHQVSLHIVSTFRIRGFFFVYLLLCCFKAFPRSE